MKAIALSLLVVTTLMRYVLFGILSVLAVLIGWCTCWLWPLFVKEDPQTKQGDLPRWCRWFQSHDAPLDELWRNGLYLKNYGSFKTKTVEQFRASKWLRWQARALWLVRNPAYGFRSQVLGFRQGDDLVRWEWKRGDWDEYGSSIELYSARRGWNPLTAMAWSLRAKWFFTPDRFLRVNLGWKLVMPGRAMIATHFNPFRTWKKEAPAVQAPEPLPAP